ncbi:MAG TPA: hypothetical protein O0X97_06020 [Methanocorpusculum sp.]|nr:hypothetical protein [Methanocorpusculum sp.]
MDETAKTEARNYLSAAGFFLIAAFWILGIFRSTSEIVNVESALAINFVVGIGVIIIATLLVILRKRDLFAILFFMLGINVLFWTVTTSLLWGLCIDAFLLLVILVTLTSKEKQKWVLFLIPLIYVIAELYYLFFGSNHVIGTIILAVLVIITLYYAFCCAAGRFHLPGFKLFTADQTTDFKASGSVLGYMLFALISGGYALYYLLGEAALPLETFVSIELLCGALMIFIAVLLFTVGKMRFTPAMFLLIGLTSILAMYSTGSMFIGVGILYIVIGLFAMLRKESRILPGIMLIVYGCTDFFTAYAGGNTPVVSVILNAIPCLIAVYLAFVVYSQRKLPKF